MVKDQLLSAASHMPSLAEVTKIPSKCNAKPTRIISCFRGNISLTRLNNFRLRLLLHCAALNEDTAVFHPRINRSRDPTCSLCRKGIENAFHFICECPALQKIRANWSSQLPTYTTPLELFHHVMCIEWHELQEAIILFLTALRRERLSILNS